MTIKEKIKNTLPIKDVSEYYVVADFDRTITNGTSMTSWSILANTDLVPEKYKSDRQKLYDKYRPIELDETMDFQKRSQLMSEWFRLHVSLFVEYGISEDVFKKAAEDIRKMEFRPHADDFLKFLCENDIPLIIISAGLGNFIEMFLKRHNCYYPNIYISSNKIEFTDGKATGVGNNIIHSLNKNEVSLPDEVKKRLSGRKKVILLGDQLSDLKMVDEKTHENVLKIGFIADDAENLRDIYEENFDIVLDSKNDYSDIIEAIFERGTDYEQ